MIHTYRPEYFKGIIYHKSKILTLLFFTAFAGSISAQKPLKKLNEPSHWLFYKWNIELLGGATSYFGDLSIYDLNPILKIAKESTPAISLRITKPIFNERIGFSGQLIKGGFRCDYSPASSFQTKIFECNVQMHANIIKIINPYKDLRFEWKVYAGMGQFKFNITGGPESTILENGSIYNPQVPEFVYFFGSTLSYKIIDSFRLTLDLSTRQAQNDYLDLYRYSHNFDYYSFLAIGLSYQIDDIKDLFRKQKTCDAYESLHREPFK